MDQVSEVEVSDEAGGCKGGLRSWVRWVVCGMG